MGPEWGQNSGPTASAEAAVGDGSDGVAFGGVVVVGTGAGSVGLAVDGGVGPVGPPVPVPATAVASTLSAARVDGRT